jgi:hypothetical protein
MSYTPTNVLQNVATYQKYDLAYMRNTAYIMKHGNHMADNIANLTGNLGTTVNYMVAPMSTVARSLSAPPTGIAQRTQSLTVDQQFQRSLALSDIQFLFNFDRGAYEKVQGEADAISIATGVELSAMQNAISQMPSYDAQGNVTGLHTEQGPYRFFGDGSTDISSVTKMAQMAYDFKEIGFAPKKFHALLPTNAVSQLLSTQFSQFTINRNNDASTDWELGGLNGIVGLEFFASNQMPQHLAGQVGQATAPANVVTVVSTNDPTGENVTLITVTVDASLSNTADAFKIGDMGQFVQGVAGKTDIRQVTRYGKKVTHLPAQMVIMSDADTVGTSTTITIRTTSDLGFCWQSGNPNQNISAPIVAGTKIQFMPSHDVGLVHSGDQFYCATPKLPETRPYDNAVYSDSETMLALRWYAGFDIQYKTHQITKDMIAALGLLPDNCMRLMFPL